MKKTLQSLIESSITPTMNLYTKNLMLYESIPTITESAESILGYTPAKVVVLRDPDNFDKYLIEFTGNLERLVKDQNIELIDAVAEVAHVNKIDVEDCTIIIDHEACKVLNLDAICRQRPLFSFVTKNN